jgi:predicted transcriptional regulator
MAESTFTFRVDPKLKAQFARAVARHDRAGSSVLREFMRKFVKQAPHDAPEYDAWFADSVQEARDDPRPTVSSETVEAHFAGRRAGSGRKFRRKG